MPIGDPITEIIPSVGAAGPTFATDLVAFLDEVKDRLEAEVPVSSLLAGTFDQANNPIVNLQYVGLYEQTASPTTPVGSLQRFGGNLWYVSPSGAFQITDGAGLNASALGGFTGDYGSPNPAEARFIDADQRYNFYDDYGAGTWAKVRARHFDLAGSSTSLNRVRLEWNGSADYTLTLPAAVPGTQTLIQQDTSGAFIQSNTLATNTDLVLSGTGKIQHGDKTISVDVQPGSAVLTAGSIGFVGTAPGSELADTAMTARWFVHGLPQGARIKSVTFYLYSAPANAVCGYGVWLVAEQFYDSSATTAVVSTTTVVTEPTPVVVGVAQNTIPYVSLTLTAPNGIGVSVMAVTVTYDIPA